MTSISRSELEKFILLYKQFGDSRIPQGTFRSQAEQRRFSRWKKRVKEGGAFDAVTMGPALLDGREEYLLKEEWESKIKDVKGSYEKNIRDLTFAHKKELMIEKRKVADLERELEQLKKSVSSGGMVQINDEDYALCFPGWEKMHPGQQAILRVGYKAALTPGKGNHYLQAWKTVSKAMFPDLFSEKKQGALSSNEYRDVLNDVLLDVEGGQIVGYEEKHEVEEEEENEPR